MVLSKSQTFAQILEEDRVLVLRLWRSPPSLCSVKKVRLYYPGNCRERARTIKHLLQDEACRMNLFPMLTDKDLKCTEILELFWSQDILKRVDYDYCREPQHGALVNLQFVQKRLRRDDTLKAYLLLEFSNRIPEARATDMFSECWENRGKTNEPSKRQDCLDCLWWQPANHDPPSWENSWLATKAGLCPVDCQHVYLFSLWVSHPPFPLLVVKSSGQILEPPVCLIITEFRIGGRVSSYTCETPSVTAHVLFHSMYTNYQLHPKTPPTLSSVAGDLCGHGTARCPTSETDIVATVALSLQCSIDI